MKRILLAIGDVWEIIWYLLCVTAAWGVVTFFLAPMSGGTTNGFFDGSTLVILILLAFGLGIFSRSQRKKAKKEKQKSKNS